MTSGERRCAERLDDKLEDDYLVWYDVPVGPKQLRPDFVVFHPRRGILALEVKDWKLSTLQSIDRARATILTELGAKTVANPLLQARVYALEIATMLQKDPRLLHPAMHAYANRLALPYGWGVVLPNMMRQQFESAHLSEAIASHLVVCQDEMVDSVDAEALQSRLWAMFTQSFPCALSLPQVERVRWHLFPEIRVRSQPGLFGDPSPTIIPDIVKVMDVQQEQLARSLGDGHRVIHGVAGSGKTMILGYRSQQLAQATTLPVLILCYNVTLAARLKHAIEDKDSTGRIAVRSFHAWCREMLVTFGVELPPSSEGFFDALVNAVIRAVDLGQIPREQYGAVLVDEGHDFRPDWLRLIPQMVHPSTNALLVLYDDAQAIYDRAQRPKFSFASVGIQARGRTTILKLNYRNTAQILAVARAFADEIVLPRDADEDGVPVVPPLAAGPQGSIPDIVRCATPRQEADLLTAQIVDQIANGRTPSEIAIIYRSERCIAEIEASLKRNGITYRSARRREDKRGLFADDTSVKLVTMHSSKGLEFDFVLIPGLGSVPKSSADEEEERRLVYVAMTRARERLFMTHCDDSPISDKLHSAVRAAAAVLG